MPFEKHCCENSVAMVTSILAHTPREDFKMLLDKF